MINPLVVEVVFCRPLFIILSFFAWPLHCLPFFDIWLPITLLASTTFSYLLTYTRTTILSQLSNLFHCNIYVKIYWRLQLFHWNLLKVVLSTKPSSPYVSNRVRLHFFNVWFFLLHRSLGFMQIPDFFVALLKS
jgi:hypothetical protein